MQMRADQAARSSGGDRFGIEGGIAGRAAESLVQFGGAPAEHVHQGEEVAVRAFGSARSACRFGQLFGEKAFEVVDGEVPADALVLDIGLEQRQRQCLAVGAAELDGAGDRHDVREGRLLGEEAADFDLRIGAEFAGGGSP